MSTNPLYYSVSESVGKNSLDARTQFYIHKNQSPEKEIPITAKVTDLKAWKKLTVVMHGTEIGLGGKEYLVYRSRLKNVFYKRKRS